jgi:hypothetical protein
MAYQPPSRFTDPWYRSLSPICKITLDYVREKCDIAGFIEFSALDWDFDLMSYSTGEQWYHMSRPEVIYTKKGTCIDDADTLGLDDSKIRRRPTADWKDIVERINKAPVEIVGDVVPQLIWVGESVLWYPRKIEQKFGIRRLNGEIYSYAINLDERVKKYARVVKLLRKRGKVTHFTELYPNAIITESPASEELQTKMTLADKYAEDTIPELEVLMNCKEGRDIPEEVKRVYFFTDSQQDWKWSRVAGWRAGLLKYTKGWSIKNRYLKLRRESDPEISWPQSEGRPAHIEWIDGKIIEWNQKRDKDGHLEPQSKSEIQFLQSVVKLMEEGD